MSLSVVGCTEGSSRPTETAFPSLSPAGSDEQDALAPAERVFKPIEGFRFVEVNRDLREPLTKQLKLAFNRPLAVDIAVKAVVSDRGEFVPVRLAAVSFELPAQVSFETLAYEIGRDFLGATPRNSSPAVDGNGVYMRGVTNGDRTESVAFFIRDNVFVYVFGGEVAAPTEIIANRLFEANVE